MMSEVLPERFCKYIIFLHNLSACEILSAISWFSIHILLTKLRKPQMAMDVFRKYFETMLLKTTIVKQCFHGSLGEFPKIP